MVSQHFDVPSGCESATCCIQYSTHWCSPTLSRAQPVLGRLVSCAHICGQCTSCINFDRVPGFHPHHLPLSPEPAPSKLHRCTVTCKQTDFQIFYTNQRIILEIYNRSQSNSSKIQQHLLTESVYGMALWPPPSTVPAIRVSMLQPGHWAMFPRLGMVGFVGKPCPGTMALNVLRCLEHQIHRCFLPVFPLYSGTMIGQNLV